MAGPRIRCVDITESVTEWMEGALVDGAREEFEEHLAICPQCTRYVDQLRLAQAALREHQGDAPAPAVRAMLLETFRRERGS